MSSAGSPTDDATRDLPAPAAHVTKIDGAPGVGKTTELFATVEEALSDGVAPESIRYLTFSRAGSKEVEERLAENEMLDEDHAEEIASTFHSAAYAVCARADIIGDGAGTVISQDHSFAEEEAFGADPFAEFADRHGLRYEEEDASLRGRRDGIEVDTGANALYAVEEWLTLTQRPDTQFMQAPVDVPIPDTKVPDLLEEWREFKENHLAGPLLRHHDYVDEAVALADDGYTLDAEVLVIDEFQDLSPQEYLLYKKWRDSLDVERAVIAGDSNQSIYSFRAASPHYFVETPADEVEVLKESHRVPQRPAAVAGGVLEANPNTDPRGFGSAKDNPGELHTERLRDRGSVAAATRGALDRARDDGWGGGTDVGAENAARVFLLSRTNNHAASVCRALKEHGIPYLRLKEDAWLDPWSDRRMREVYGLVRRCIIGDPLRVPAKWLSTLADYTPISHRRVREALAEEFDADSYNPPAIADWKTEVPDGSFANETMQVALEATRYDTFPQLARDAKFASYKGEALFNAVDKVYSDEKNGNPAGYVRVGTIHSAKGFEAPSVFLFDGYNKRLEEAYRSDPEQRAEEHRLYYVGASRAMNELTIARDFVGGYTFPAFDGRVPTSTPDGDNGGGDE